MKKLLIALVLLSVLDGLITVHGLKAGAIELNPLYQELETWKFWFVKGLGTIGIASLLLLWKNLKAAKIVVAGMVTICMIGVLTLLVSCTAEHPLEPMYVEEITSSVVNADEYNVGSYELTKRLPLSTDNRVVYSLQPWKYMVTAADVTLQAQEYIGSLLRFIGQPAWLENGMGLSGVNQWLMMYHLDKYNVVDGAFDIWLYRDSEAAPMYIYRKGSGYAYFASGDGQIYVNLVGKLFVDGTETSTVVGCSAGEWHHLVFTGIETNGISYFYVGSYNSIYDFDGKIGEHRLWDEYTEEELIGIYEIEKWRYK